MTLLEIHKFNISEILKKKFEEDLKELDCLICYQDHYDKFTIDIFRGGGTTETIIIRVEILDVRIDEDIFLENIDFIKDFVNRISIFLVQELKCENESNS